MRRGERPLLKYPPTRYPAGPVEIRFVDRDPADTHPVAAPSTVDDPTSPDDLDQRDVS
jgi:hypothetical protein